MFKERPGMSMGKKVAVGVMAVFVSLAGKAAARNASPGAFFATLVICAIGASIIWLLTHGGKGHPLYDQFFARIEKYAGEFSLDRDQRECLLKKAGRVLEEEITAPEKDALFFALDHFHKELASGRNHRYKGELTPYGEALLEAYIRLNSLGAERGFIAKDKAEQDLDDLRAVIRAWG